jgi:hypothetical protein
MNLPRGYHLVVSCIVYASWPVTFRPALSLALAVFGQLRPVWPPFTSNIVLELWVETDPSSKSDPSTKASKAATNVNAQLGPDPLLGVTPAGGFSDDAQGPANDNVDKTLATSSVQGASTTGTAAQRYHDLRRLQGDSKSGAAAPGSTAGAGSGADAEAADAWSGQQWVRVLHNKEPLVVPEYGTKGGSVQGTNYKQVRGRITVEC